MDDISSLLSLIQEEVQTNGIKFAMSDFFNADKTIGMCTVYLKDGFVVEVRRREQTYDERSNI